MRAEQYEQQVMDMSGGAAPAPGVASYPLYGYPPMGQVDDTPFYRQPLVCFSAGAAVVGIAWAYFGWWRPRQKKVKKNAERSED